MKLGTVLVFFVLALLVLAIVFAAIKSTEKVPALGPLQLVVSSDSTPFFQKIYVPENGINRLLQMPLIHRVMTEKRKTLRQNTAKLSSTNVTVFLPTPTKAGLQLTFLPSPVNSINKNIQCKFDGPQLQQYYLKFQNPYVNSVLISESDGAGGFHWVRLLGTSDDLQAASQGGGKAGQGTSGENNPLGPLIEFFEWAEKGKGAYETFVTFLEWWTGTGPEDPLTNQDIIDDVTQVINEAIAQGYQSNIKAFSQNLNITMTTALPQNFTTFAQTFSYNDTWTGPSPIIQPDPHGVLTNGYAHRTSTFNIASTTMFNLALFMNSFTNAAYWMNNTSVTGSGSPVPFWYAQLQYVSYYILLAQTAAQYDPTVSNNSYTAPWASNILQTAQIVLSQDFGIAALYNLYNQFLTAYQNNFVWQNVPYEQGIGNYCGVNRDASGDVICDGCGDTGGSGCPVFSSLINNNGSDWLLPQGNNGKACQLSNSPSDVVAAPDGSGTYSCNDNPPASLPPNLLPSFTMYLENYVLNDPTAVFDYLAEIAGVSCTSFTDTVTNDLTWTCDTISATYVENGTTFTSGAWFGLSNGSASASLSKQGVHLYCSSATAVNILSDTSYEKFLFEVENFATFSQSVYDEWDPNFTLNGGCCPENTVGIRTCWEGSVSDSVGSQSTGVQGKRKFWCVTQSIYNNVSVTVDAMSVTACVIPTHTATLSASLFPFASTTAQMANFSSFFMPSRAQQFWFSNSSGLFGAGYWNINPDASNFATVNNGAAQSIWSFANGTCSGAPESVSNVAGTLAPGASLTGFPGATSTAVVPQLMAYAFSAQNVPGTWIIPTLEANGSVRVSDGTKTVSLQAQPEINAILGMPQPNFAPSFGGNTLWGMASPSQTTLPNPWTPGLSIVFMNQNQTILAPGTTVSASSSVTAVVLENAYAQVTGTTKSTATCVVGGNRLQPKALCDPCGVSSEFSDFNWYGYGDLGIDSQNPATAFAAPTSWTLQFHYPTP